MATLWRAFRGLVRNPEPQLYRFNEAASRLLPLDEKAEEEYHDDAAKPRYYPMRIGDVLKDRYQVLGKVGFGLGSTSWLANDFRYV